jgi:hypothetical protein
VIFKHMVALASWFDILPKNWRFEVSDNGWPADEISLHCPQTIFIPSTNSRVRGRFRILILNSHGSHLTPKADQICAENDIMPFCVPSNSSHLL